MINQKIGKTILIIDDNDSLRDIIKEVLTLENFKVLTAKDGLEGLEFAISYRPDLILCDIVMPGLDGFTVKKRLMEDLSTMMIPFIFLTAVAEYEEIRKGMSVYGADDYLIKPISLEEIISAIKTRLEKSETITKIISNKLDILKNRIITFLPHELRTPLQGILGFSSIIREDEGALTRAEIQEMARIIEDSGHRLYTLIENYLQYTRNVAGQNTPSNRTGSLNIGELVPVLAQRTAHRYDRINDLNVQISPMAVDMEKEDMEFIIREVVDNAFKFSKTGSPVKVSCAASNNQLVIHVSDKGIGFPTERLQEIGAFNQFDRNFHEQQGSGLGLITTKLIAQRYGGDMEILNNHPGSLVLITIPT